MKDIFYRFPDKLIALDQLEPFGMAFVNENNERCFLQGTHDFALCEVGEILGVDGWHVNLRLCNDSIDVSAVDEFIVKPNTPKVVWA